MKCAREKSFCVMIFSTCSVKKLVVLLVFYYDEVVIVSHMHSIVVHYICIFDFGSDLFIGCTEVLRWVKCCFILNCRVL